jgi:histidyl-tRNA synthetase
MTPTLARMVGARAQALKKPIRWFSIPQLFRYERQQRGRLREHFQLNMDLIGESSPLADAELVAAAIDIMRAFGLGPADVQARISDRRVLRALLLGAGVPEAKLSEAFVLIDRAERMPEADLVRAVREALGKPDSFLEIARLKGLDHVIAALSKVKGGEEAGEPLITAVKALGAMGLGDFVQVDLSIVRGLAYYTGVVFELFDAKRELRAICGGGRYDGLLKSLGGIDLPALGFGMGDVVLGELLKERGAVPKTGGRLEAFLVAVSGEDVPFVLKLAHDLRDRGVAIEYGLKPKAVRNQIELAAARGAARAVIVGPDERASGLLVVKDLRTGSEAKVPHQVVLGSYFDGMAG